MLLRPLHIIGKQEKFHIRLSFSDLCDRAMVVIQIADSAKQRLIGRCEVIAPSDVDTHRLAGLHLLLHRCRFFCQSKISECECFPHLIFDIGKIPFRLKISQQQGWLAPQYLRIVIARRFPVGQILPAAQQPPGTMEGTHTGIGDLLILLFCHVLIGNTEYRKLIDPLLFLCAITGYVVDSDVFSH